MAKTTIFYDGEKIVDAEQPVRVTMKTAGKILATDVTVTSGAGSSDISPSTSDPRMDGEASPGSATEYARGDHVHPHDTAKQDVLVFDDEPMRNSTNMLTSGAVYASESRIGDNLNRNYLSKIGYQEGQIVKADGAGKLMPVEDRSIQYTEQLLTSAQKSRARNNIDAASVDQFDNVLKYKGEVISMTELPMQDNSIGDTYYVYQRDAVYTWYVTIDNPDGSWVGPGEPIDMSLYRTAAAQDVIDEGKVDVAQGIINANKFLITDDNGDVTTGYVPDSQIQAAVDNWLDDHPDATTTVEDGSISEVKLNSALSEKVNSGGMSDAARRALLLLLSKVYYADDNGPEYLELLESELFPPNSLSAVFTQGEAIIYNVDDIETLRQYLVVTAYYNNNVSKVVTLYTLSGRLTPGTSTITATYGSKTATFDVTVTKQPNGLVDGTYGGIGMSSIQLTSSSNELTWTASSTSYVQVYIPFKNPVTLKPDDVVKVTTTTANPNLTTRQLNIRLSASASKTATSTAWLGLSAYQYATTSKSTTVNTGFVAKYMGFQSADSFSTANVCTVTLYVNGEEVFTHE